VGIGSKDNTFLEHLLFLTLTYTLFGGSYIIYMTFFIPLLEQQGVSAFNVGFIWAALKNYQ
jgi:hypothetical protein